MPTKTKESALKAARKALGQNATEGVDFNLRNTGAGWDFETIPAANEAAARAKAKRAPKPKADVIDMSKAKVHVTATGLRELAAREPDEAKAAKLRARADAQEAKARKKLATPKQQNKSAGAKLAHPKRKVSTTPKGESDTDTKTARFIEMLKAPGGATSKELEAAMGWQSHSVRGLIGTLKKRGENVVSKKLKGEPTIYRIAVTKAPAAEVGDVI